MDTIEMLWNDFKAAVEILPKPYFEYTITERMNNFCAAREAGDEVMENAWFSSVMLNYKPMIIKLYKQHHLALKLELIDFIDWFQGAIMQAAENKSWQDASKNCNAGTVITQIVNTRYLAAAYYESNLAINKANFATISLDATLDRDTEDTRLDLLESNFENPADQYNNAVAIIQKLLNKNKIIEAIIVETIVFNDCMKVESKTVKETDEDGNIKKYKNISSSFWPYRVVQVLSNLPENYTDYFTNKFSVDKKKFEVGLQKIRTTPNPKLYEFLEYTQHYLRATL